MQGPPPDKAATRQALFMHEVPVHVNATMEEEVGQARSPGRTRRLKSEDLSFWCEGKPKGQRPFRGVQPKKRHTPILNDNGMENNVNDDRN